MSGQNVPRCPRPSLPPATTGGALLAVSGASGAPSRSGIHLARTPGGHNDGVSECGMIAVCRRSDSRAMRECRATSGELVAVFRRQSKHLQLLLVR